jgi:hypothetical protein
MVAVFLSVVTRQFHDDSIVEPIMYRASSRELSLKCQSFDISELP